MYYNFFVAMLKLYYYVNYVSTRLTIKIQIYIYKISIILHLLTRN